MSEPEGACQDLAQANRSVNGWSAIDLVQPERGEPVADDRTPTAISAVSRAGTRVCDVAGQPEVVRGARRAATSTTTETSVPSFDAVQDVQGGRECGDRDGELPGPAAAPGEARAATTRQREADETLAAARASGPTASG